MLIYILLQSIAVLMIAVIVHEAGHAIFALISGVKVEVFGIGFGKPYIHKKIFGIDFRLSPWLIGGYTSMVGEGDKRPNGFLAQPYHKKVVILLAGIFMNLLVACICYWINYGNIIYGICIDIHLLRDILFKSDTFISYFFASTYSNPPNIFLLQLSSFNLFCAGFNLIPFPALDGSLVFLVGLEKVMTVKRFVKVLKYICWIGFVTLILAQFVVLYIWWLL